MLPLHHLSWANTVINMKFVFSDLEFIKQLAEHKHSLHTVFTSNEPFTYLYNILEDLIISDVPFVHTISVEHKIEKINVGKVCRYLWQRLSAAEKRLITKNILLASVKGINLLKKLVQHLPGILFYKSEIEIQSKVLTLLKLRNRPEELPIPEELGTGVVSKVITFNLEDQMDPEVIDAIYLTVKQTGANSCVIRCSQQAIREEFHKDSNAHILVSVGHGYLRKPGMFGYRCGPFTGTHDDVVYRMSEMLVQLPSLKQFILTHCYYGATPKYLPRDLEVSYMRSEDPIQREQVTASVIWKPEAINCIPFKKSSFAAMLWFRLMSRGMLDKGFAITATPQILNPYPYSCPTHFIAADKDTYHPDCTHGSFWEKETSCNLSRATTITLVARRRPSFHLYTRQATPEEVSVDLCAASAARGSAKPVPSS